MAREELDETLAHRPRRAQDGDGDALGARYGELGGDGKNGSHRMGSLAKSDSKYSAPEIGVQYLRAPTGQMRGVGTRRCGEIGGEGRRSRWPVAAAKTGHLFPGRCTKGARGGLPRKGAAARITSPRVAGPDRG